MFDISVNLQNNGGTTARGITVGVSGAGVQKVSDNLPDSVAAGGNVGGILTLKATSSGTHTVTITVSSTNADSVSKQITVTVTAGTTTTVSGGGVSGAIGGAVNLTQESHSWSQLAPGMTGTMKILSTSISIRNITITVKNTTQNAKLVVRKLSGRPESVLTDAPGKIYQYLEIDAINLNEDILSDVKIVFNVEKSWIKSNNIDETTIRLNRYVYNSWQPLPTTRLGEDDNFVYFESTTPGFSVFAVTGEEASVVTTVSPTTVQTTPPSPTTILTTTTIKEEMISKEESYIWVILLLALILVAILMVKWMPWREKRSSLFHLFF